MPQMLILSFSGTGENSLTLKSLDVLEAHPDVEPFKKIVIKPTFDYDNFDDVVEEIKKADAVIWAVSPFHMNIQSHMLRFFEEMRKRNIRLSNVNTFFQTNVRVCDNFLSATLEKQIRSIASVFVQGLSYSTSDMVNEKLSLYTLSTPDPPPKMFHKPASYEEREGLKTAVQWYKIIKAFTEVVNQPIHLNLITTNTPLKVMFVDMSEEEQEQSDFIEVTLRQLQNFYKEAGCTVEDVKQRDYSVKCCDGCKICYASKVCKFKDDFLKYEEKIQKADILIYYGKCECGFISSLGKKMIDREVHNGLMPVDGKLPSEMEKFRAVGYVLEGDIDSCMAFKDYAFCLASFGFQHFLGVLTPNVSHTCINTLTFANYSLLIEKERMIPQRNFWTEKVGHHFSDLSRNIPNVIPEEAKYYRKAGGYNPVTVDTSAATITPETFGIGVKMRQIPYDKAIEALKKNNKDKTKE